MCRDAGHSRDAESGQLLDLCDRAVLCLLVRFGLATDEDVAGLDPKGTFDVPAEWKPAFHVFSSFQHNAKSALIEFNYFDLDYRSELALMQESAYGPMLPSTSRVHFFRSAAPAEPTRLRAFVADQVVEEPPSDTEKLSYLGYIVIRPRSAQRVGRSLVTPHAPIRNDENKIVVPAHVVAAQARTAAIEYVNVFGIYLLAVGFPFMEQDGNLLRCAHVSAWVAHYTAMLRGAVARRPTAHFHRVSEGRFAIGRQYPSGGVSTPELTYILRHSDMPTDILTFDVLRTPRQPMWADRADTRARLTKYEDAFLYEGVIGKDNDQLKALRAAGNSDWTRENTGAAICRYLNSGMPVILVRKGMIHTQVVVGYLRERDLVDTDLPGAPETEAGASTEVLYFIVSDDQDGPFYVVSMEQLVTEIVGKITDLLVPLPRSLWMSGDTAERLGTRMLEQMTELRRDRLSDPDSPWLPPVIAKDQATPEEMLAEVSEFATGLAEGKYTVRSYVTTGVDLKASVADRIGESEMTMQIAHLQLPKYVWVVEAINRQSRKDRVREVVHATIVLDASDTVAVDLNSKDALRLQPPLFAHLPGHMRVSRYAWAFAEPIDRDDSVTAEDEGWLAAPLAPYRSGRWNYEELLHQSPWRAGNQARSAVVGSAATS